MIIRRRALLALAALPLAAAAPDAFASLEAASGARIGVAGVDTGSGATVSHRADERFPLCSTFKLLAACAILARAAAEPALLGTAVRIRPEALVPYSPVTGRQVGGQMTLDAICAAALQYSDNTAGNLMLGQVGGPEGLTAYARSIGDAAFRLDRWETALNADVPGDPRDTSTPAAMATDLRRAALGDLLQPAERARLVGWMRGCTTGLRRIRAVAPAGAAVADKTGGGAYGAANDIAAIWPADAAPLVIAVYTTMPEQDATGRDQTVAAAAAIALRCLARSR